MLASFDGRLSFPSLPFPSLPSFSLPRSSSFLPCSSSILPPRMAWVGSRGQAQMPLEGRGGGHHARLRLPPQRPARALPRPGPHAPISEEPLGGVGGRSAQWREKDSERLCLCSCGRGGWRTTERGGGGPFMEPSSPLSVLYGFIAIRSL